MPMLKTVEMMKASLSKQLIFFITRELVPCVCETKRYVSVQGMEMPLCTSDVLKQDGVYT